MLVKLMTDLQILEAITRIQRLDYKEDELGGLLEGLKQATRCRQISDLIFYGEASDTPELILNKAREYHPFQL